jgi:gluconolactonase
MDFIVNVYSNCWRSIQKELIMIYPLLVIIVLFGIVKQLESQSLQSASIYLHPGHQSILAPNAEVRKIATGFTHADGPVSDAQGNLYFSDVPNSLIYIWTIDGRQVLFRENTGWANGLAFDSDSNLIMCEDHNRRIGMISQNGQYKVVIDHYQAKKFNSPNDLWIDPKGGIYFTDPCYGDRDSMQLAGEYVFYVVPERNHCFLVAEDLQQPNGILGKPDSKTIYISDWVAKVIYVYTINQNGSLSDRRIFLKDGSDGLTMDEQGNLYAATQRDGPPYVISVYNPDGVKLEEIEIPEQPASMEFGGRDKSTLFITARTSLFSILTRTRGINRK